MHILVCATRASHPKKVDIHGTFRGTYRQIFTLCCGIILANMAAASFFTQMFRSAVIIPPVYVGLITGAFIFMEVIFPGKVDGAKQTQSLNEKKRSQYFLGNWNFTLVAFEASEAEQLKKVIVSRRDKQSGIDKSSTCLFDSRKEGCYYTVERYEATLAWRKEVMADMILSMPQPYYDTIKAYADFSPFVCTVYFSLIESFMFMHYTQRMTSLDILFILRKLTRSTPRS